MLRDICENSVIRAVLTCISSLGLHEGNESFPFQNGILGYVYIHGNDRVTKRYVISGHASPVFHADVFPRLVKYDVTTQPVNMKEQHSFGNLRT